MFGKTSLTIRAILFWGLVSISVVESSRQKKDVHHMIYLHDSRKPSRNHRPKDYDHQDSYEENRPKKLRRKPEGKKHQQSTLEDQSEEMSYEEVSRPKPNKPKRHHHKQAHHSSRNQKRHNSRRHPNDHKKHQKNHENYDPIQSHRMSTDNWIPLSSKEFFGKEHQNQNYYFSGNGLGHQAQGYIQPVPLEITTPLPLQSLDAYLLQSTVYPPLSLLKPNVQNSARPLIETVESYKPFDYSILEQKLQNLNPGAQEVSSSNLVKIKHDGGNAGTPFSIVVENSQENKEKKEGRDKKKDERDCNKTDKRKEKGKRVRGGSRYRVRSKN